MSKIALEAKTKEHEILKAYLEENASDILIEKINNGVKVQKDGKTLINKKTFETFMDFAAEEALKLAKKGARYAAFEGSIIIGWLIHYFEEESIEGTLYNEDGSEYKKPVTVKKPAYKTEVKIEAKPPEKKIGEVISMFEGLEDIFPNTKNNNGSNDNNDDIIEENEPEIEEEVIEEPAQKIEIEPPIEEKPKPTLYDTYMEVQGRYPDHVIMKRMGDFYEIFGENATLIGNELNMTITSRELGNGHRFAMIGFSYHSLDAYVNRILKNYSIVIIENGEEIVRNKIEPVKIENEGIVVDKKTGEVVDEELPYSIEHVAILAEIFGMENLEGC